MENLDKLINDAIMEMAKDPQNAEGYHKLAEYTYNKKTMTK